MLDQYDIDRIARDAAQSAADDVRRELQHEIDMLRRRVDDLDRGLDEERSSRREADSILDSAINSLPIGGN